MEFDYKKCESVIGYTFKDKKLLNTAFTHSSFANEHSDAESNERLEFLGDSLLGYIVSEKLYNDYPEREGVLTVKKQALVSRKPLSRAIKDNGLEKFIIFGEGEKRNANNVNDSICENLFEAVTAAIYLDGGILSAKNFVLSFLKKEFESDTEKTSDSMIDYKSQLLHIVQEKHLGEIKYEEVAKCGPAHQPIFKMSVSVDGHVLGYGEGTSHKCAEKMAAFAAIKLLQSED